jgi:hypothetical protein
MQCTRRQFTGHLVGGGLGVALAGGALTLEGCSAIDDLESWVPVGLAAFDGVAAIVDTVFTTISTTVDALWAAVENAISIYQHTADPTTTTLDKVIATLDALSGGLTQALAALPISIPAAVLAAAKAVLALTIATLKSIQARLEPTSTTRAAAVKASAVPPAKSKSDYVKQVNAIMAANGQTFRVR